MDKKALGGLLKRIKNYNIDTFSDRLILQKTVYLLQEFLKTNFGYRFNWYISGPYSPDLTQQLYQLRIIDESLITQKFVDESMEKKYSVFINEFLADKENDAIWLELIASIHYLVKYGNYLNREDIYNKIKRKMLSVTKCQIDDAINYLTRWNMITQV